MIALLHHLLTAPMPPAAGEAIASLEALRARTREAAAAFPVPFDCAAVTAFASDRVAFAFAAGYQAALHTLLPALPTDVAVSLCATEEGGAHPRAIATRLEAADEGFVLRGKKRWSTFAPAADALLVVASVGADEGGKNRLRLVRVDAKAEGVRIDPMPPTPFAPELPHAELTLEGVRIRGEDVLEGDGYDRYLKPFRTIEDLHVFGALIAHVLGVARALSWPHDIALELAASLVTFRAMALSDPTAPELHIALGGALAHIRALLDRATPLFGAAPDETRTRWERDRALLGIAGTARAKRLQAAWAALDGADR
ncbi:acyl-CoA dehydrogenase family protein [Pendulispora albinea]|uniref:Acyl-CoA dehydrogenase family protein n=1 Tax=Pendulispora albinea TaxID=2741071 RepID=A0ABZ2MBG7_9BACT